MGSTTGIFLGHTSILKTKCRPVLHQRRCENGIVVGISIRICTWHLFIAEQKRPLHLLVGSSIHYASGLAIWASLSPTFQSFDRMFSWPEGQRRHNECCFTLSVRSFRPPVPS